MGALLDTPKTDKDSLASEGNGLKAVATGMQGWRVEMEDAHVCTAAIPSHPKHSIFGVFDGHGGKTAAQSSAVNLIKSMEKVSGYKNAKSMLSWSDIVYKTFFSLDVLLDKELMSGVDKSGCTGVVAIVGPEYIVCGNAGDSRCVLSRGCRAIPLSIDHKPDNVTERQRVRKAGGEVVMGRVNGELAVSRSLGDFKYKKKKGLPPEAQAVTCMPDVRAIERTSFDDFIILACDGVWDVMSSQEVVDFVHKEISEGVLDPTVITSKLLDHCLANQSRDNMTVCLVLFLENLKSPSPGNVSQPSTQGSSLEFSPMHINSQDASRVHSPICPVVDAAPSSPGLDKSTPRVQVTDTSSLDCDEGSRPVSPHIRSSMTSSRPSSARSPKSGALFSYNVPTTSTSPIVSDAPSTSVTLAPAVVVVESSVIVSEHTRSNSVVVPSSPRMLSGPGNGLKRSLSVTKLHEMLGSSGLLVKVPSLYDPVKKSLEIDKEIEEKAEQLIGAKSKAFESGTSVGGRPKPSLTLDSSEDDSDSAKDPFADDGDYDWGAMGDDAIVPDSQDYGIVPDLASCLPRNSPSLKGYLPVLEAHRLPAKHGRRAAAGIASVHPAASPYVNGGPGGPRSKASRSKVKQHPSVSFEGGETETGAPILRSPSGREVRVLAPLKGGELQSKPHVPTMSHHAPSATPLSELRMRYGVSSPQVNVIGPKQPSSRTRVPSAGKAKPSAIPSARSQKPPISAEADVFSFQDVEGVLSIKPAPITPALPPSGPPALVSENSVHRLAGNSADMFTGLSIADAIDADDSFTIAPVAKLPSPIAQLELVHMRTPTKPVKSSRATSLSRDVLPAPLNDVVVTHLTPARRESRDMITPVDGEGRVPMSSSRSQSDDRQYTLAPVFQDPVSVSAPTVEAEFLEAIKGISNKKRPVKSAKHHVTGSGTSFGSATPSSSGVPSSAATPIGEVVFALPPLAAVRSSSNVVSKSSPAAPLDPSHRNALIAEHGKDLIVSSFGGVAASHLSRAGRFAVDKF